MSDTKKNTDCAGEVFFSATKQLHFIPGYPVKYSHLLIKHKKRKKNQGHYIQIIGLSLTLRVQKTQGGENPQKQ